MTQNLGAPAEEPTPDRLTLLASLYGIERQDLANISNVALALVAAGLAYLLAAMFGLSQADDDSGLGLLWAFAPLPMFSLAPFHSLLVALAIVRTRSCQVIEKELTDGSGLESDEFGTQAGDAIMDLTRAARPYKAANIVTYGGVAIVLLGLVVYCLVSASFSGIAWPILTPFVLLYVFLLGLFAWSWRETLSTASAA